jgi:hypothetical protein
MKKVNWTLVVVISLVILFILMFGASLLSGRGYGGLGYGGWGYGGWGMMGPWMMGGMLFMWLIPIGFIILAVFGIAWLVRAIGGGTNPPAPAHLCPSCGRSVQIDWKNCPYCGTALTK